ncbi:MAG: molybdopterin-dependent oxidoreductase [Raoultibacter sp.]
MSNTIKTVAGVAGAMTLLVSGTAFAAEPVDQIAVDNTQATWTHVDGTVSVVQAQEMVPYVQGEFTYTQNSITPNYRIAQVFQRATNALCNATTELTVAANAADWKISVVGDVANSYTATLGELAVDDEQTTLMGCACASNGAGGPAVINAEVTGIPLVSIIEKAAPAEAVNTVTLVSEDGYRMAVPLDYVMARKSLVSYRINQDPLTASVGGTNQLWIDSAAAKYFSRNIVSIELTIENAMPAVPGTETDAAGQYVNRPNAGITSAA